MHMKTVAVALALALAGGAVQAADFHVPSAATVELRDGAVDMRVADQLTAAPLRHAIPLYTFESVASLKGWSSGSSRS